MKLPCLNNKNLGIFSITADQRFKMGNDIFLNTHLPIKFERYNKANKEDIWSEDRLFYEIRSKKLNDISNNVYIIYGASGSGKSEAIRWLEIKLQEQDINRTICRISRIEIDPAMILNKIRNLVEDDTNQYNLSNWSNLKNKPITFANNLIWNSLSSLLDSDELIIPISYKIRPLIEENLKNIFDQIENTQESSNISFDIFPVEELSKIIEESDLEIKIDYEKLRNQLIKQFDQQVFGDFGFVETFKNIGESLLNKTGYRPILLIDDLVQSMNIYASDLLDLFITFGDNSWDIVIGLTPSSLEDSIRGRNLLTRIDSLDTFDDRIVKLWISDNSGQVSYFLNDKNIYDYAKKYLLEYKKLNGYDCNSSCFNFNKCKHLHWGEYDDVIYSPFNKYLIKRLYKNLQNHKGQLRQFNIKMSEYIKANIKNNTLNFLKNNVIREKSVNLANEKHKIYIESLMPDKSKDSIKVSKEFINIMNWNYNEEIEAKIVELKIDSNFQYMKQINNKEKIKPEMKAVRDWIENKKSINKELLKPMRNNITKFILEFNDILSLKKYFTSNLGSMIRRHIKYNGALIPLNIEGIDKNKGVNINKGIGVGALLLMKLEDIEDKEEYINEIFSNYEFTKIFFESSSLNKKWKKQLDIELKKETEEIVFILYSFIFHIVKLDSVPKILYNHYKMSTLYKLPDNWKDNVKELNEKEISFLEKLFDDWFLNRNNLYDGNSLSKYIIKFNSFKTLINQIDKLNTLKISKEFKTKNNYTENILNNIILKLKTYSKLLKNKNFINKLKEDIEIIMMLKNYNHSYFNGIVELIENNMDSYIDLSKLKLLSEKIRNDNNKFIISKDSKIPECIGDIYIDIKKSKFIWYKEIKAIWDLFYIDLNKMSYKTKNLSKEIKSYNLYKYDLKFNIHDIKMSFIKIFKLKEEMNILERNIKQIKQLERIYSIIDNNYLLQLNLFIKSYSNLLSNKINNRYDIKLYSLLIKKYFSIIRKYHYNYNDIKENDLFAARKIYFIYKNGKLNNLKINICNELIKKLELYYFLIENNIIQYNDANKLDKYKSYFIIEKEYEKIRLKDHNKIYNELNNLFLYLQTQINKNLSSELYLLILEILDLGYHKINVNQLNKSLIEEIRNIDNSDLIILNFDTYYNT